jgi:hypothetical protein
VGTSTVADFERGHRTLVQNNADAIRAALGGAGISFPPGGAVVGPAVPPLAPRSKSGAPIRWVNATDLWHWSDARDGQGSIPALVSKLIIATGPIPLHVPSDEGVQQSGWDGTTNAEVGSQYVPAGSAGWR